jgi:hypothetical protein
MPTPSRTLALSVVLGILAVAAAIILHSRKDPAIAETAPSDGSPVADPANPSAKDPRTGKSSTEPQKAPENDRLQTPQVSPSTPSQPLRQDTPTTPRADYQPPASKYKNARNTIARRALAGVGADPESERIWLEAINDPNLPADERKDLIEDLNEDGISNPGRPAQRDLPLIKSRIALIEQLTPSAMDQTNAAAFKEAHKDLVNMVDQLQR